MLSRQLISDHRPSSSMSVVIIIVHPIVFDWMMVFPEFFGDEGADFF